MGQAYDVCEDLFDNRVGSTHFYNNSLLQPQGREKKAGARWEEISFELVARFATAGGFHLLQWIRRKRGPLHTYYSDEFPVTGLMLPVGDNSNEAASNPDDQKTKTEKAIIRIILLYN